MLEFIQLIKQRYQSLLTQLDKQKPYFFDYQQRVDQLLFAEAFMRRGQLLEAMPKFPLQIAVIGPTQAGKSSLVNLLLQSSVAEVSPLAGYTVHPHGFCHGMSSGMLPGLQTYFGRFQCQDASLLSRNRYDCYSLATSPNPVSGLPQGVYWDTPDFDSIDAADYREGVIRTIALADIIVLVVSKEKYADQSVWEVMKIIQTFQQPTLICINKLSEDSTAEVLESWAQKWLQNRSDPLPEIIPVLFAKSGTQPILPKTAPLAIAKLAKQVSRSKHPQYQQLWLNRYWQQWLEPVAAEHQAQRSWQYLVDTSIQQALTAYQRDYLHHPYHNDSFQRALVNLLNLLEFPGTAKVMGKLRRAMTWPVRMLLNLGQEKYQPIAQEAMLLEQIGEHVLIQLADNLLEKTETESQPLAWWKDTAVMLRQNKADILADYNRAVAHYHRHFQQDVDDAAQQLYQKLQEQPMVLNSLRATRLSTDAAGMMLAIQAGGIGVQDLVITPLMLTVTSLLAESAIGSYMHRVEAELKQRQLQTVKMQLFEHMLRQRLERVPLLAQSAHRFNIPEPLCLQAEQALKEKKHGLRLL